jgi:two-component system NarL family sensor kinase
MPPESAVLLRDIEIYTHLIWLLVLIITVGMLFLCYLFLSMRRAEKRETQSLAFSHLAIEGLETERRRVSRELHDVVLPQVKDPAVSALVRSICMELMPPDFTRLSLKDSLADLCVQFTRKTEIECACSIEEALDFAWLTPENRLQLYRMVQEAFTNIEKHSKAGRATLIIRRNMRGSSEHILICVSDDGVGLSSMTGLHSIPGLGMGSMRQRAAILGATLDFISESGNGLMVRIEIPLQSNTEYFNG